MALGPKSLCDCILIRPLATLVPLSVIIPRHKVSMVTRLVGNVMSVRLARLAHGWAGDGIYGDFTACGSVVDYDGISKLNGTEYEGHIHEVPVTALGAPDPLAMLLGLEDPSGMVTEDDVNDAIADSLTFLESFGWPEPEITVVTETEFMASV